MQSSNGRKGLRLVVALGGNALLRRGESPTAETQRGRAAEAMEAIAALAGEHEVVLTHGNGPQVGLLALQAMAYTSVPPYPLDLLGAESEGMIGYVLEQELRNRLPASRTAVTVLTQVVVGRDDPAFKAPSKPIGPVYDEEQARRLAAELGWTVAPDGGYFRRVVPSPQPLQIVELPAIRLLVESGALVVCVGGGGIPVVDGDGTLHGVEAVIDKDLAAELLARSLDADLLLMLTDVEAVMDGWGGDAPTPIRRATPSELRARDWAAGSMGPKVEAACRFVEATGGTAAIGALGDATRIVAGAAGTIVTPG